MWGTVEVAVGVMAAVGKAVEAVVATAVAGVVGRAVWAAEATAAALGAMAEAESAAVDVAAGTVVMRVEREACRAMAACQSLRRAPRPQRA